MTTAASSAANLRCLPFCGSIRTANPISFGTSAKKGKTQGRLAGVVKNIIKLVLLRRPHETSECIMEAQESP